MLKSLDALYKKFFEKSVTKIKRLFLMLLFSGVGMCALYLLLYGACLPALGEKVQEKYQVLERRVTVITLRGPMIALVAVTLLCASLFVQISVQEGQAGPIAPMSAIEVPVPERLPVPSSTGNASLLPVETSRNTTFVVLLVVGMLVAPFGAAAIHRLAQKPH